MCFTKGPIFAITVTMFSVVDDARNVGANDTFVGVFDAFLPILLRHSHS